MRVLVVAGGSGGHLFPAVAVMKVLQRNEANQIYFLTSQRGRGEAVIKDLQLSGKLLTMRGLPRGVSSQWWAFFRELSSSYQKTKKVFDDFIPEIVLAHGGYVSFPALLLAWERGIPFCLQEQNVIPGLVTKLFLKKAQRVFGCHLQLSSPHVIDCGNPVRPRLWEPDAAASRQSFGLEEDKFTLLVLGGSQGAKSINQIFAATWKMLEKNYNFQVIWSSGETNYEEVKNTVFPSSSLNIQPFIEDMGTAYMAADLVISRAGATTISELNACGKPAILIPYTHAAHNHQFYNAQYQVENKAAILLEEKKLTPQKLAEQILNLFKEREKLSEMAENSLNLGRRQAAPFIVAEMNKVVDDWQEDTESFI